MDGALAARLSFGHGQGTARQVDWMLAAVAELHALLEVRLEQVELTLAGLRSEVHARRAAPSCC
jgi:hypothetical protein